MINGKSLSMDPTVIKPVKNITNNTAPKTPMKIEQINFKSRP
jgi:hypothetical protein